MELSTESINRNYKKSVGKKFSADFFCEKVASNEVSCCDIIGVTSVLSTLYSAKSPCLLAHLLRWIF